MHLGLSEHSSLQVSRFAGLMKKVNSKVLEIMVKPSEARVGLVLLSLRKMCVRLV